MSESTVSKNKAVFFTYSIVDDKGDKLEHSDLPVGYVHGADSGILEKLEKKLEGCKVGDLLEVPITPEEGFGEHDPELTFTDELENVPEEFRYVGAQVEMQNDDGETRNFVVSKIEDGKLTVDGNHPFAGKDITFVIKITEIRDATAEEISSGRPGEKPVLH